jgi:hypothetical protein
MSVSSVDIDSQQDQHDGVSRAADTTGSRARRLRRVRDARAEVTPRTKSRTVGALLRVLAVPAALLIISGVIAGTAGEASATVVSWPNLGGIHDQVVTCDRYNHRITITPQAAPMFGYHGGQVVRADFWVADYGFNNWTSYPNLMLATRVLPAYIGNAILGSTGGEYDYQYNLSGLGTVTINGNPGHNYVVAVNYTYYNAARQVVATDMHSTSSYSGGYFGFSGTTWIPSSSTVACGT